MKSKHSLRNRFIEWRKSLDREEWRTRSRRLCNHLLVRDEVTGSDDILGFAPIDKEVRLFNFFRDLPDDVQVYLPRVDDDQLRIHRIGDREQLVKCLESDTIEDGFLRGAYEILEPDPEVHKEVDVRQVDLVLVPGLAFDSDGHRVGYGGGYYDRLLAETDDSTLTVGTCFEAQVVREDFPVEPHDVSVDRIVTEDGFQ